MANSGSLPDEPTGRLKWRCSDLDCLHDTTCREKVMWSDDGSVQIRGELFWNEDDGKWDWVVRVEVYGSTARLQPLVEAEVARHARRMASAVGVKFRGPKVVGVDDVD